MEGSSSLPISRGSRQYYNRLAKNLVHEFQKQAGHLDNLAQQEVLHRFVCHPAMAAAYNPMTIIGSENSQMIMNLRDSLQMVKGSHSHDQLAAKNVMLSMVASEPDLEPSKRMNKAATARLLGVNPRMFKNACERKKKIKMKTELWANGSRQPRSNRLAQEVVDKIQVFWAENTRVSPNRKDLRRRKLGKGKQNFITHPTHYLEISQAEMYLQFKEANPDVNIGQRVFERCKPFYVKKLKERNTCCCVYHVQLDLLRMSLNALRTSSTLHKNCSCNCTICEWKEGMQSCMAPKKTFCRLREIWEMAVCAKDEEAEWHKLSCLLGNCSQCGIKNITFCPKELDEISPLVEWKIYEDVKIGIDEEGRPKNRKQLVNKKTPPADLIRFFKQHVKDFIIHNFTACWEDKQYRECLRNFPPGVIISVIDFSENFTFKTQNEIQSSYYTTEQVTILVHITYRRDEQYDDPIKEYHFYISEDKKHDTLFVQHCLLQHYEWMKKQGYEVNEHWVWSDGAAAHFKARRPFYFVPRYFNITGVPMKWSFFGSGHGKGEHDGAGAKVKFKIAQEQLKLDSAIEPHAHELTSWLTQNFSTGAAVTCQSRARDVTRYFWEVKNGDVNRSEAWDCEVVEGTRKIHSICGINKEDPTKIITRQFACFCTFCMYGDIHQCENLTQIGGWTAGILVPKHGRSGYNLREHIEVGDVDEYTPLADLVEVGTIFAVEAPIDNEEDDVFWLVYCSRPKHVLEEDMIDMHGNKFVKGEEVLEGKYFERYITNRSNSSGSTSYIFGGRSTEAIVYAEQVVHIIVDMPKGHQVKGKKTVHLLGIADKEKIMEKLM